MWGLIVSLLFLSPILDGFQALDDSGRPLPGAVLTFLRPGTTVPKPVYTDQELDTELSDNRGRVVADGEGRFPVIYLAYDPTPRYRVMLHTAQGVLRWDIDPYLCDCTEPPYVFRGPKHQALAESGRPLTGARLIFSITETETPAKTYADAELTVPHPNPLIADSGGFFPPVYLDDDVDYRVRLTDRRGELLLDIDPYVCECGFLLLTSKPYPVENVDALATSGVVTRIRRDASASDAVFLRGAVLGVSSESIVKLYEYPPELLATTGAVLNVEVETVVKPPIEYEMEPEGVELGGAVMSAASTKVVVYYEQYQPEGIESEGAVLSASSTKV